MASAFRPKHSHFSHLDDTSFGWHRVLRALAQAWLEKISQVPV